MYQLIGQAANVAQTTTTFTVTTESSGGISAGLLLFWLALAVFYLVCSWKIYTKAGKPGWAAIVPIYNIIVLLDIVRKPIWWILLMFIPFVNIVVAIIVLLELAKVFGKGTGTGLLLIFLPIIGYPMLAFGDATYNGTDDDSGSSQQPVQPAPPMPSPPQQPVQ